MEVDQSIHSRRIYYMNKPPQNQFQGKRPPQSVNNRPPLKNQKTFHIDTSSEETQSKNDSLAMENSDYISVTLSDVGVNCTEEDGCSAKQYGVKDQLQDIGAPPWSFPNDNLPEIKDMKLPDMRQWSKKSANAQESRKEGYIQAPLVDVPNKIRMQENNDYV
ncbi:unnamed protein product [Ceratitis capitata]|uniref:(Mediterranean fruit fly) hypothetical protein n=1 Tax=Ceratitis capitata TaxID=7213 RepID=A0A811UQ15_CERCA|nr:unnamed protein product [Ceratitis capitata]